MSRRSGEPIQVLEFNEPLTWHDYAIEWVLGVALVVSPLAYGSTNPWSQEILYALIGIVALLAGAKLSFVRGTRFIFTWAYLPMLLYLVLVTISVIPLPAGLVRAISPGTYEEKSRLMADIPNVGELLSRLTISFNTWTTLRGLRLMMAVSVLFAVVVNIYQTPSQIKRLLGTVAMAGLVVTSITVAQNVTHDPDQPYRIFWNIPFISTDAVHPNAGPFPGKAQLGQYLNLTIGAMVALALVLIAESFEGEEPSSRDIVDRLGSLRLRIAGLLILSGMVAALTIAWSLSRGAMLGLAVGGVLVSILLSVKRGWRKRETILLINAMIVVAIAISITYALFESKFGKMVATTGNSGVSRITLIKSMVPMFRTWPIMGTGSESFEWTFPLFQPKDLGGFYVFAENDYAQVLTDTGIVGGILVLAFVVVMLGHWIGAYRGRRPIHMAAVGIGLGLLAIMVHSFSDFSQHASAIAAVTSVLLGLLVSLHRLAQRPVEAKQRQLPSFGWTPWPRLIVAGLVVAAMGWSVWSLDYLRRAEILAYESDPGSSSFKTAVTDPDFQARLDEYYDPVIADDAEACRLDSTNVLYMHWVNHFRWRKLTARRDDKTGVIIFPANAKEVAQQIVDEMSSARVFCPCYGKLYTLLGAIQWEFSDKKEAVRNLEIGHERRPADPEPLYYLARVAAIQGRWDHSEAFATRCCSLNGGFSEPLIKLYVKVLHRPDMAAHIFRDNTGALWRLTDELSDQPQLLRQTRARLLVLADQQVQVEPTNARAWAFLAKWASELGEDSRTIDAYRKSLDLDYGNVEVRMNLARFLQRVGRKDDAIQEVEICLRIQPQNADAKTLLASLTGLVTPPVKP